MKYFHLYLSIWFFTACQAQVPRLKDGDILFQASYSQQSEAVEIATNSPYSHCGILFYENGKPYVYEAIQPVGKQTLEAWINAGINGKVVVKRLIDSTWNTPQNIEKMKAFCAQQFGKNYDAVFNWSDKEWYCSELVWKAYKNVLQLNLCTPKPLKSYNIDDVRVRKIMNQRYGNEIPYDENMVAPVDIFNSPLLKEVYKN